MARREGRTVYAIGCDVGSQSLKGVLLSPDGRISATAAATYPIRYPAPAWAEQDAHEWQSALAAVVRQLIRDAAIAPRDVRGLALASQVDGVVAVDGYNRPLRPALIWMDRRAVDQAARWRERIDADELRAITGLNLDAYHGAPKIDWIRDTDPETARAADAFLLPGSFLVTWLTGRRVVDHGNASSTMLYDVIGRCWSERLLEHARLEPRQLGEVAPATAEAGPLTPAGADALGLTSACRVFVGTGDEHGAALAAGAIRTGIACDITGTAEPVGVGVTFPIIDPSGLVETHGHADPRAWFIENPGFVSGGSIRWYLDALGGDEDRMNAEAATIPPGSDGVTFLPALSGSTAPHWDEHARGAFVGLSLGHGRGALGRAVFEGCTFALRDLVDGLAAIGLDTDEIRVVGGGARSRLWLQMKADITGRTVRVLEVNEATALGAGYLAGVGCGIFTDLDDAIERATVLEPGAFEPDAHARDAYDEAYARYRAAFDALAPLKLGRARVSPMPTASPSTAADAASVGSTA